MSLNGPEYCEQYDNETLITYYHRRKNKLNAFSGERIPKKIKFKFYHMWNPFTGERLDIDKNGPLLFNALEYYDFIFANRYRCLWINNNTIDEEANNYYGEILGTGKDMTINTKYRHKYLYNLQIDDCYLPKNNDVNFRSLITFGPILNDDEIAKIDNIVKKNYKDRTPMSELKKLYDGALDNSPSIDIINKYKRIFPNYTYEQLVNTYNTECVNKLVSLRK